MSDTHLRPKPPHALRIALLHLAPVPGRVEQNRRRITAALQTAAGAGADWVVTPELAVSGYGFYALTGSDWIAPQPEPWTRRLQARVKKLGLTLFLGTPERDRDTGELFNAVLVLRPDGTIAGRHHKVCVVPGGLENWSTPGKTAVPLQVGPLRVGILVCADAYRPEVAQQLKDQGAQLLISSAAWMPGEHGPNGAWEQRTLDTGLPLIVCNRTGLDTGMSFEDAESIVSIAGRRLFTYQSPQPAVILTDWDPESLTLLNPNPSIIPLHRS